MMARVFSITVLIVLPSILFLFVLSYAFKPPVKKEYQKGFDAGYQKGYGEATQQFINKDALRQEQFFNQMKRMEQAIINYRKATKNIQGI